MSTPAQFAQNNAFDAAPTSSPTQTATPAATLNGPLVLEVGGVSKSFGGLKAVQKFHLHLHQGDLQGLIGPNGAGKTTAFNLLTGVYRPDEGKVVLAGQTIVGLRPWKIASLGMARTFQNIRLFGELSVLDNVKLASHVRARRGMLEAVLRTPGHVGEERAIEAQARELLRLFDLDDRRDEQAKSLPYGDQRKVEIARALATRPKVLLLDEPAAGMNPQEKNGLRDLIRRVRREFGVAILLIEHDMGVVMNLCEKITVLDYGVTIAVGSPADIQRNPRVIEAYLGAGGEETPVTQDAKRERDQVALAGHDASVPEIIEEHVQQHRRPNDDQPNSTPGGGSRA